MSIFNLKTSMSQLEASNVGVNRMQYEQIPPSRDVSTSNFTNGSIHFHWQNSADKYWIPNKTYIRLRCSLTKADGSALVSADDIAVNMNFGASLFTSGEFRIADRTVSRVPDFFGQVDAIENRIYKSKSYMDSFGKSSNFMDPVVNNRKHTYQHFESIWTPSLSIFKVDHAIPGGRFELVLNPESLSMVQKQAIESLGDSSKKPKTGALGETPDYNFQVESMHLYILTCIGPRADDIQYYLDLESTSCMTDTIQGTALSQKNFDVPPSTYGVSVAYQDARYREDTRLSCSKFKSYNSDIQLNKDTALGLTRFYINYGGQNFPQPDADPAFKTDVTNYMIQRYAETMIQNGACFDTGGSESFEDWVNRGMYLHFKVHRDGTDRSTRLVVNSEFSSLAPADLTNMRMLLFAHYRQVARVTVKNGNVIDCVLEDA